MPVTFEQPLFLLVALLALPCAVVALRWFNTMTRLRAWTAIVARSVLIGLCAAMLAGAASVRTSDVLGVVCVVDVSASVREFAEFHRRPDGGAAPGPATATAPRVLPTVALRRWLEEASAGAGRDDRLGLVAFAGYPLALAMPRRARDVRVTLDHAPGEGTDIASALRFARALFPPGAARRVVLVSDGNETTGDAIEAARELAGSGVAIDVLPVAYAVRSEVMVEAVDVPPQAPSESTVLVRVVLRSTGPASGTLDLLYEGEALDLNADAPGTAMNVRLRAGENVQLIPVTLGRRTIHRFEPVFTPASPAMDQIATNNRAETFTVTPGKGSVLIVDGVDDGARAGDGSVLARTLRDAGINVEVVAPGAVPDNLLALQQHDLIILQNVASEEIPRRTHQALVDSVRELGAGLVMIGGPDSFGAGGWNGTALAEILPVRLDLPEQLITPSAAIVIVLDSSGSMARPVLGGSRTQQEIANEGAAIAIETLDRTDLVGVIAFASGHRTVVPLGRNTDPRESSRRVRAIGSNGGTNLYPAMDEGASWLLGADANVKHMIILSDGQAQGAPRLGFETARRLHEAGVTVSTIAVGDDADRQTLATIAQEGGGQFYHVTNPNVLPRVFVKDIRVVRKPLIREVRFNPVVADEGSTLVAGLGRRLPDLYGLVLTRVRDDPRASYPIVTPEGEPVLAQWAVGRGQVAAFTSDAHRWARDWLGWSGYAQLWTQIVREVSRPLADTETELTTSFEGDELTIRLDASDDEGRPMDLLRVPGTLYAPSGERVPVRLSQVGPGVYETTVRGEEAGNYVITLSPQRGGTRLAPVIGGLSRPVGPEHRALQSNVDLLRRIAQETGGRVLDIDDPRAVALFDRSGMRPTRSASPLWPVLLGWSLFVFLLDVGTRRVAWDRFLARPLREEMAHRAASGDRAGRAVARLRRAVAPGGGARVEGEAGTGAPVVERRGTGRERAREEEEARAREREQRRLQEEQRRKVLRAQMLERLSGTGEGARREGQSGQQPAEPGGTPTDTSGLLAAKRRAQRRFERGEDDGA